MPISVEVINDVYVLLVAEGILAESDFSEVNEWLYANLDKATAKYQIVDLRNLTDLQISTAGIERLAMHDKNTAKSLGKVVVAVVAPGDLEYGYSRMWEVYAATPEIETNVFRNLEKALNWIMSIINQDT